MRILMAIGLIMALAAPALAEPPPVLYPGSRCFRVGAEGEKLGAVTVTVPALLVAVSDAAEANAEHEILGRCVQRLADCRTESRPSSKWTVAAKWAAVGAAIGAAFVAGVWVGK